MNSTRMWAGSAANEFKFHYREINHKERIRDMRNKIPINEMEDMKESLFRRSDLTKEILLVTGDKAIELTLSTK